MCVCVCVLVSADRWEQTQSILASYTLLSIPPFHSSSPKAHIFGTSSRLGGESYRVEKKGGFSLVISGGNAAWCNSPLPVSAAAALEPPTKRCHCGSCWTKRRKLSSFYECSALPCPNSSPSTEETVFAPRRARCG